MTLDSAGDVGVNTSVTVGSDGFPFVTYRDNQNGNLKAVHCTSVSCAGSDAPLVLDSTSDVGWYSSVTVGADGNPFVAYLDLTNGDLKAVHCTSASCVARDAPIALDAAGDVGHYTSVTVGADGFPYVTYQDRTNFDLKGLHCTSASCATRDAPLALDAAGGVGKYTSVAVGSDGFPFVTYVDDTILTSTDLKALHCTNVSCATRDAPLFLDTSVWVGEDTSVTLGSDGFPFVTYRDVTNADLRSLHCASVTCVTRDAPVAVDSAGSVGTNSSVTLGSDGFPFVTYQDSTNGDLRAVHCSNIRCIPFHRRR